MVGLKKGCFCKTVYVSFLSLFLLLTDSSSIGIVDWRITNNFKRLLILYAISNVGEIVGFVSQ